MFLLSINFFYAQDLEIVIEPFEINDSQDTLHNYWPNGLITADGSIYFTWIRGDLNDDRRLGEASGQIDVMFSGFDENGNKLNQNFSVVDSVTEDFYFIEPRLHYMESSNKLYHSWKYTGADYGPILLKELDNKGDIISRNDEAGNIGYGSTNIDLFDIADTLALIWSAQEEGTIVVKGQKLNNNLGTLGSEMFFNNRYGYLEGDTDFTQIGHNDIFISWHSQGFEADSIYVAKYNLEGEQVSPLYNIYELPAGQFVSDLKVCTVTDERVVIAWAETDWNNSTFAAIRIVKITSDGYITGELNLQNPDHLQRYDVLELFQLAGDNVLLIYNSEENITGILLNKNLEIISEYILYQLSEDKSETAFKFSYMNGSLLITWHQSKSDSALYSTWAKMVEFDSSVDVQPISVPAEFYISQNYPNPFNPTTTIEYSIPELMNVRIDVFNVLGQKITTLINEQKPAGNYKVTYNASATAYGVNLSSGIYYYQITTNEFRQTSKMILVR